VPLPIHGWKSVFDIYKCTSIGSLIEPVCVLCDLPGKARPSPSSSISLKVVGRGIITIGRGLELRLVNTNDPKPQCYTYTYNRVTAIPAFSPSLPPWLILEHIDRFPTAARRVFPFQLWLPRGEAAPTGYRQQGTENEVDKSHAADQAVDAPIHDYGQSRPSRSIS
jgi:hypothetical protein